MDEKTLNAQVKEFAGQLCDQAAGYKELLEAANLLIDQAILLIRQGALETQPISTIAELTPVQPSPNISPIPAPPALAEGSAPKSDLPIAAAFRL